MMRPKLNELITLISTTEDYSSGDLVVVQGTTSTFWGNVKEMKSPATASGQSSMTQTGMRLRDHRLIQITARSRDVSGVVIGSEVQIEGTTGTFTITDVYDITHDRYVSLIAEYRG